MRSPADRQVGVDGLAGDEQVHDLGRALEDAVDPQVAQHLLGGHGALAAGGQRLGGLVAAAAADLDQLVGDPPGHLASRTAWRARPRSGCRCGPRRPAATDRSSTASRAKVVAAMKAIFAADGLVLADRPAPLHPRAPTTRGRSSGTTCRRRRSIAGQRQPAGVERGQGDLQTLRPRGRCRFAAGTRTWWKRVTPFSMPRRPMKALRFSTVMPGESASTTNAVMPPLWPSRVGHPGHDDEQVGDDAVGRPQLDAVEHVVVAVAVGVAVVASRAGSEPTSGSVSRNALMAPRGAAGQERRPSAPRCRTSFSGCGTPIDWCADSSAPTRGCTEPTSISALL